MKKHFLVLIDGDPSALVVNSNTLADAKSVWIHYKDLDDVAFTEVSIKEGVSSLFENCLVDLSAHTYEIL